MQNPITDSCQAAGAPDPDAREFPLEGCEYPDVSLYDLVLHVQADVQAARDTMTRATDMMSGALDQQSRRVRRLEMLLGILAGGLVGTWVGVAATRRRRAP